MGDFVGMAVIAIGAPLLGIALASWLLHYLVALTAPPTTRAAWTVGIAYFLIVVLCIAAVPEEYWWQAPLAAIPGAFIAFWWWRDDFRRDWIDDAQVVPEGVELANDDWRVGLVFVGALIVFFVLRVLLKAVSQGLL